LYKPKIAEQFLDSCQDFIEILNFFRCKASAKTNWWPDSHGHQFAKVLRILNQKFNI